MKLFRISVVLLLLFFPSPSEADEIDLPAELNAGASLLVSDVGGLWEKSLVVVFPQKRNVLSTNEGLIEGRIVMNHAAHPELFRKVCVEMKTKDEVGGKVSIVVCKPSSTQREIETL